MSGGQNHAAHIGAPVALQPFPGDGKVVFQLTVQKGRHPAHVHGIGEFDDVRHGQAAGVGPSAALLRHLALAEQHLAVALDVGDVGMMAGDPHGSHVLPPVGGDEDVQLVAIPHGQNPDGGMGQVVPDCFDFLRSDLGDDLQLTVLPARHDAGSGGSLDALQTAGMGHHHAFDVFDDVAAAAHGEPFRQTAQHTAGLRRAVGNGDGLGASHGGDQLFGQDIQINLGKFFCHENDLTISVFSLQGKTR